MGLGSAINAPNDPVTNTNTYMGYKFFSFAQVETMKLAVQAAPMLAPLRLPTTLVTLRRQAGQTSPIK
jgi:hypothetical protein